MMARSIAFSDPVEGLNGQQPGLRRAYRRQALEGRRSSVVVDRDAVEERRRRAARANRVELVVRRLDRLVHPSLGVRQEILDRCHSSSSS
jgi:hypothetical protein